MRLTQQELQIIGAYKKRSPEKLKLNFPHIYRKAREYKKITFCHNCAVEMYRLTDDHRYCYTCSLTLREQHIHPNIKQVRGGVIKATKEAWENAGWFPKEKLQHHYLGKQDGFKCYMV